MSQARTPLSAASTLGLRTRRPDGHLAALLLQQSQDHQCHLVASHTSQAQPAWHCLLILSCHPASLTFAVCLGCRSRPDLERPRPPSGHLDQRLSPLPTAGNSASPSVARLRVRGAEARRRDQDLQMPGATVKSCVAAKAETVRNRSRRNHPTNAAIFHC